MTTIANTQTLLLAMADLCPIPFVKMNGSGNDFVMLDNREAIIPPFLVSALTQYVCRRGLSVGADGVVLIDLPRQSAISDFSWRYVNADGSDGDMCGNGAMCGAAFAAHLAICAGSCTFETPTGLVHATLAADPSTVTLLMNDTGARQERLSFPTDHGILTFYPLSVGVPHVVMFVEDADTFLSASEFDALGRCICHHAAFQPTGTNVNIVSLRPDGTLRMRTWERGVNAETLACGTGAIATAVTAVDVLGLTPLVEVVTSGGPTLTVSFEPDPAGARHVHLSGQVALVAQGKILPDALR